MQSKKIIWNAMVLLAIAFLVFMFADNDKLGPLPQFVALPTQTALPNLTLRVIKSVELHTDAPDDLTALKKLPVSSSSEQLFQAESHATAWVVQVVAGPAPEQMIKKLQEQKLTVFSSPFPAEKMQPMLYVGPYLQRQEAEQAASEIKNAFGFRGDVVKFNPLTM